MKLHHNKKRNVGLVYEFLTREVSAAILAGDKPRAARALGIINRHLSEGTALYEELSLHRQVMEARGGNERLARRIVDELKAAGIRFSSISGRDLAKTALIHEMNRVLGRDIFDRYRIPDYTAHASVSLLLSRGFDGRLDEGIEIARVEEHLVEFLKTSPGETPRYDKDATLFAYRKAVDLFEQEFGRELSPEQRDLLREYVRVSLGNVPDPFVRLFEKQRNQLREVLRDRRSDKVFIEDKEMSSKLDEAIRGLEQIPAVPTDENVEQLILYHNLKREIES